MPRLYYHANFVIGNSVFNQPEEDFQGSESGSLRSQTCIGPGERLAQA